MIRDALPSSRAPKSGLCAVLGHLYGLSEAGAIRDTMTESFRERGVPAKPGAALKALRAKRGWTLADVSKRTGLTISALSKVEHNKTALTFEKLVKISQGLGIDISELFGSASTETPPAGGSRRSVTRAGEGRSIDMDRGSYLYVASELLNKKMVPIIGEVVARSLSEYNKLLRHSGEEYVFVIEGTLELHTEAYTPVRLDQGDSVYFDSSMGHAYIAVGDASCRILSICATSEEQLVGALEAEAERKYARPELQISANISSKQLTPELGATEKRRSRPRAHTS